MKTQKQKRKEKKQGLEVLVLSLLFLALSLGWIGQHNIDNSWNVLLISYNEKLDLYNSHCDMTATGNCIKFDRLYVIGQICVLASKVILAIDVLLLFFMYLYKEDLR